ncbi:MAG: PKD domain-containing protein [Bacteroidales bacterium]|jgi:PKD repeat protein|nr:PKD domain-containing protein [Bacteroidales bacterium]MDI9553242.1 PKD domain-containing protein [Bacteroidota bacterium]
MRNFILFLLLCIFSANLSGQTCTIISKANNITPDKLCSPVTVSWTVSYTGVNNAGTPVEIRLDWDNGSVVTVPAIQSGPGVFSATASNTYTSAGRICNYHPKATLIVNGTLCTSSTQEQIVTVWDDDDHNGGNMHINPEIYPVCYGNSADVRFQDLTQFNCVPPQERDNPNINTRWIQWIYGTDITMTGQPVTIEGRSRSYPYTDNVITLTGPVTGSGVMSKVINVAADKNVGEYFQVTLRNWNYCNPYDDPNIPGPPKDRVNGDNPPVETTAIILIVDYPDATIDPVARMCANAPPVTLTAHDPGGNWSGKGVSGNKFDPSVAGVGSHIIRYNITNAEGCSDTDTAIVKVMPVPDATIDPVPTLCITDTTITLTAASDGGIWSGPGVTGNIFNPAISGYGNHQIEYKIVDSNGCMDSDLITITVATPDATIIPIDTLCINHAPITLIAHDMGGVWSGPGVTDDKFDPAIAGPGTHTIHYSIVNPECSDSDTEDITVVPIPVVDINRVGTVYINGPAINLTATPAGGIFSGPAVTGYVFDPAEAGLGTHVISYETIMDKYGCYGTDTIHIQVLMPPLPVADFSPDTVGCSPLTVQFTNKSLYGETYMWGFGDGQYSVKENPVHTYYVPGSYIVKLIVYNIAGESVHNGIVTVYQNPTAILEAYPTDVINNEQVVVFSNNSMHDSISFWRFGDGMTSEEKNPYHKYMEQGSYIVTLIVTSKDGCIDSAQLATPVRVDWKVGDIDFPNVFKWNETGPTGGFWRPGCYPEMDYVFRPFYENVSEYKLQIFNRWGVLIYESSDLYQGWDGYSRDGKLAVQGVYVWKVTGRYADGDYFTKVGDVTFLH